MAKSGQEVVCEGWLTKSPPTKRIWRARWRRRWFALSYSGELPGQYLLTYYTDRNCRKMKGIINLDHCEQVDFGLRFEERKIEFNHVFDIKTPTRTYYLAADTHEEMKAWVSSICRVCNLKCTSSDEDLHVSENTVNDSDVVYCEEESTNDRHVVEPGSFNDTPPISPASTGPYIELADCFTGKSPLQVDAQDFNKLLQQNIGNPIYKTDSMQIHTNKTYELPQQPHYLNYVNDMQDPRFYDCPRQLAPPPHQLINKNNDTTTNNNNKDELNKTTTDESALQSPTDSESVFTDEDWVPNTSNDLNSSKNTRPSDSSTDMEITVTAEYRKCNKELNGFIPPRPPKSIHVAVNNYFNINPPTVTSNNSPSYIPDDKKLPNNTDPQKIVLSDEMYDFPRSHQVESESNRNSLGRRHMYNNAEPVTIDGHFFRYDISPTINNKPGTSGGVAQTTTFGYDLDDIQDNGVVGEPPSSPISQTSSTTTAYSNLPSPLLLLTELQLKPPVNRDLKPKRKLSDSLSVTSNPEPQSPRVAAPSVDRKLKPVTPLQEAHMRKQFNVDDENRPKIRAAPSPTPPNGKNNVGRSFESLLLPNEEVLYANSSNNKMEYLDLDLECKPSNDCGGRVISSRSQLKSPGSNTTVYKQVDFVKTDAFNQTKNDLEKQRKEPVDFGGKK